MSYGNNGMEAHHAIGVLAADLPAQQSTKAELMLNLKTAKALGITVPLAILTRADKVTE